MRTMHVCTGDLSQLVADFGTNWISVVIYTPLELPAFTEDGTDPI
jgi:hypothetical protein